MKRMSDLMIHIMILAKSLAWRWPANVLFGRSPRFTRAILTFLNFASLKIGLLLPGSIVDLVPHLLVLLPQLCLLRRDVSTIPAGHGLDLLLSLSHCFINLSVSPVIQGEKFFLCWKIIQGACLFNTSTSFSVNLLAASSTSTEVYKSVKSFLNFM